MASWDFPPARMLGTECASRRWVLGPISRHPAPGKARPQMPAPAVLAAMALAVDAAAEPVPHEPPPNIATAPKYGVDRFRLLPPWQDPKLVMGPVTPPHPWPNISKNFAPIRSPARSWGRSSRRSSRPREAPG